MTKSRAKKEAEIETITLSARFSPEQKEVIDMAAVQADQSATKLMRDATMKRAMDVVNSSGKHTQMLRSLVLKVVYQLVNPSITRTCQHQLERVPDLAETRRLAEYRGQDEAERQAEDAALKDNDYTLGEWMPETLTESEKRQLKSALETCGSVLCEMMLEGWEAAKYDELEYEPVLTADGLGLVKD